MLGAGVPYSDPGRAFRTIDRDLRDKIRQRDELLRQKGAAIRAAETARAQSDAAGYGRAGYRDRARGIRSQYVAESRAEFGRRRTNDLELEIQELNRQISRLETQKIDAIPAMRAHEDAAAQYREAQRLASAEDRSAQRAGEQQDAISSLGNAALTIESFLAGQLLDDTPDGQELAGLANQLGTAAEGGDLAGGKELLNQVLKIAPNLEDIDKQQLAPFLKSLGDAKKSVARFAAEAAARGTAVTPATSAGAVPTALPASDEPFSLGKVGLHSGPVDVGRLMGRERGSAGLVPTTSDEAANQADPVYRKIQLLRDALSQESATMRGDQPQANQSLAGFLQGASPPRGETFAPRRPLATPGFPTTDLTTVYQRGVTPLTPTVRADEEAVVPDDIRRGEAFREGRFFTNIGTPGAEIRRVLPRTLDELARNPATAGETVSAFPQPAPGVAPGGGSAFRRFVGPPRPFYDEPPAPESMTGRAILGAGRLASRMYGALPEGGSMIRLERPDIRAAIPESLRGENHPIERGLRAVVREGLAVGRDVGRPLRDLVTPEEQVVVRPLVLSAPGAQDTLRVKDRASGRMGTVPASEFSDELYELAGDVASAIGPRDAGAAEAAPSRNLGTATTGIRGRDPLAESRTGEPQRLIRVEENATGRIGWLDEDEYDGNFYSAVRR